jgi:hypothetical protein
MNLTDGTMQVGMNLGTADAKGRCGTTNGSNLRLSGCRLTLSPHPSKTGFNPQVVIDFT